MKVDNLKQTLFAGFNANDWPEILSFSQDSNEVVIVDMGVSENISWFKGHFPEQAVLPGVVQTHWVGCLSETLFKLDDFTKVSNLKFKNMILPGVQVSLSLKHKEEKNSVVFKFYDDNMTYTEGQMFFNSSLN